ncbi:MAG: hypothetical protein V8R14_05835 [Clostridia bacterium]
MCLGGPGAVFWMWDNCYKRRSDSIHRIYACTDIQEES